MMIGKLVHFSRGTHRQQVVEKYKDIKTSPAHTLSQAALSSDRDLFPFFVDVHLLRKEGKINLVPFVCVVSYYDTVRLSITPRQTIRLRTTCLHTNMISSGFGPGINKHVNVAVVLFVLLSLITMPPPLGQSGTRDKPTRKKKTRGVGPTNVSPFASPAATAVFRICSRV